MSTPLPARIARPAWVLVAACLAVLSSAPAMTVGADYKTSYRKAIEAINKKRWQEAERLMREALAEQPQEGGRVNISGNWWEPYVPYYYIGIARARSGDCAGAMASWNTSEQQAFVKSVDQFSALQKERKQCSAALAASATAKPSSGPTPTPAQPAAPTVAAAQGKPDQPVAADQRLAAAPTEPALPPLVRVTPATPVAPTPAAPPSARVEPTVPSPTAMPAPALPTTKPAAAPAVRPVADLSPEIQDARDQLRSAIDARRWSDARRLVSRLEQLSAPADLLREPKAAVERGVASAETERDGILAFYRGDYATAKLRLEPLTTGPDPTPRAWLYLACSEAALALVQRRDLPARMERARQLFARARPRENDFRLDRQFISPRLLQELER
jgi:hypothetical protein